MPKPGKIYVHFEAAEPNFTMPLELTPDLNYDDVVDAFCQRYNTKHGASRTLDALAVQASVNNKPQDGYVMVAESVSSGDDVYIVSKDGTYAEQSAPPPAPQSAPSAPPAPPAPPADETATPPPAAPRGQAIKLKVYVHYEGVGGGAPTATKATTVTDSEYTVGEAIRAFVAHYNEKHAELYRDGGRSDFIPLDALTLCARTDSQVVVMPDALVSQHFSQGDDLWVVPLEVALKEDNTPGACEGAANRIEASRGKARDKSYYYWAQNPVPDEAPAPREAPKQIRTRAAKTEEMTHFKTISAYSFESEDSVVKVYISMPGVGALPKESFVSEFAARSFTVKVMDYNGFNHRLQVPKLTEYIVPEESKLVVKTNTLIVRLKKVKADYFWYELHKTKGIGETEEK